MEAIRKFARFDPVGVLNSVPFPYTEKAACAFRQGPAVRVRFSNPIFSLKRLFSRTMPLGLFGLQVSLSGWPSITDWRKFAVMAGWGWFQL